MEGYDAIVIGAGNGGMMTSVLLAQQGRKVLLLERHNVPGGCATTFRRGRFEFEISLHLLSCLGSPQKPGPLRPLFESIGILDDLEIVDIEDIGRIILPGRVDVTLKTDRTQVVGELQRAFPREREAVEKYFEFVDKYCSEFFGALFLNDPNVTREKYPLLYQHGFKNFKQLLDHFFQDPELKASLGLFWILIGLPPGHLHFSTLVMTFWLAFEFGFHHVQGGSQAISNAVVNRFLSFGGTVRFDCGVKRIAVENGAVKGVVTEEDDFIPAKCVVSNASTVTTYRDLVGPEHVPEHIFEDMRRSTLGPSGVLLLVGLDCEPGEVGIHESMTCVLDHTDIGERPLNEMRQLDFGSDVLGFSCFDVANPDFSPKGTCQLNVVALKYGEPWMELPPSQYFDAKYRCADAMLNRIEENFPGLRSHIEEVEVATPLTFMRYLGHPNGAIYGFHRYTKDIPFTKASSFTPGSDIRGLYSAGAWVGDLGYPATYLSGVMAADAVLKDLKG